MENFDHLSSKIGQLLFARTEGDRSIILKTLDDLNSLNYRYPIIKNSTRAVLLINQCCSIIPFDDSLLVPKCCQLVTSLIKTQNVVVEGTTLIISIQWCLQALKNNPKNVTPDILKALEGLLRNNLHNITILLDSIIEEVHQYITCHIQEPELSFIALQCLEACTVIPNDPKPKNIEKFYSYFEKCAAIFLSFLHVNKSFSGTFVYSKMLETCFVGLQNIVILHPYYLHKELGLILGICKTYMLYKLKGIDFLPPEQLKPATLSLPEESVSYKEKCGGKITKQRKPVPSLFNRKREQHQKKNEDMIADNRNNGYIPANLSLDYNSDSGLGNLSINCRAKTSDSDFSDNEGGKMAKLYHSWGRIRQAALNLLSSAIKRTENPVIFSYWTHFIPEGPSLGQHNLTTCILKDTSVRGRMCALNALMLLLTSSKWYLAQAEPSDKSSSFTPFSVVLGLTLIELHRTLSLALCQLSVPVLALVLKCMAVLVQATPYHKLNPGLATKIVRNVKCLIYHKDASVQVTALIVMGCILAFEPVFPEIQQAMIKLEKENTGEKAVDKASSSKSVLDGDEDFDYAQFSSDDDEEIEIEETQVPWLLQRCLTNLGVLQAEQSNKQEKFQQRIVPAPVKLESLQILSAMSRNYFEALMLPHIHLITKGLEHSLEDDKYKDLNLHAAKAIDCIGQAMGRFTQKDASSLACVNFWQSLLSGPLVSLIQNEQSFHLRAVGCDCLGSIGPGIFQQLSRDKQIVCVTLLFACAKDEEPVVRGAAVRALALSVMYPTLREDPGFVEDTAESILYSLRDLSNITLRVKAAWSLGNFSDALVLNVQTPDSYEHRLPDKVLYSLFEEGIKCSKDGDKMKMNIVRALGNFMLLVDERLLEQTRFKTVCQEVFGVLVNASTTSGNMKVRWNACYGLRKALKNPSICENLDTNLWQSSVFNALMDLVVLKNFKVRINAALAITSPSKRTHYGSYFIPIWTALLKALENSQHLENFTEYKHRDNLVEQLCLSLGRLTTLLTKDDLIALESTLNLYFDCLKTHMHKVLERMVPEKSTDLSSAACYLDTLGSTCNGKNDIILVERLKSVFSYSVI